VELRGFEPLTLACLCVGDCGPSAVEVAAAPPAGGRPRPLPTHKPPRRRSCWLGRRGRRPLLAAAGDAPRGAPRDPAGSHHLYLQLVVLLAVISIRHPRPPSAPVGSPLAGSPTQSDRTSQQAHHPNGMNTTVRIRRGHDAQEAKFLPARIPRMLIGSSQGASPPADPSVSASGEAGVSTESLS
jgi:hypothetical protein